MEEKYSDKKTDIIDILLYSFLLIIFVILVVVTSVTPVHASNSNINSNSYSTCGGTSSSTYGAFYSGSCHNANIGTTYTGNATTLGFRIKKSFVPGNYYTLTINMKDNDLLGSSYIDVVRLIDIQNNNNEYNTSYSFISKKQFKVYFSVPVNTSDIAISLASGSGDPITGVSTFGVASLYLDDNDNTEDIINNQNQNTSDIINNANTNSQDIINSQNQNTSDIIDTSKLNAFNIEQTIKQMLAVTCKNVFNWNGDFVAYNGVVQQVTNEGSVKMTVTNRSYGYLATVVNVKPNTRYYIRTLSISSNANYKGGVSVRALPSLSTIASINGANTSVSGYTGAINGYFDTGSNNKVAIYLFVTDSTVTTNTIQYDTIMITETQGETFCPFGSVLSNKLEGIEGAIQGGLSTVDDSIQDVNDTLDTTNDKLDDINDTLTDSNIDNGVGSDFFDDFNENDPGGISGIVTRPLLIINSLLDNNNKCIDLALPSFMTVSDAVLPSGCILWNKVANDLPIGITLWNIFVCGVCSYVILCDLFKLIENLKSPTHNKVEVLDL